MNESLQKFKNHFHIKPAPSPEEIELFAKTQKYTKCISWIPGLRMVAICNTLSMYCSDEDSDIDLFIVADEKRMWLVRILITAIFHVLGVRRHGKKVAKRFCLSFFATMKGLDFNSFRLEHDIYLAYWIYYLKPIYDTGDTYTILRELNTNWTGKFFMSDERHPDEQRWQIHRHPELVSGSCGSKACHCEKGNDVAIQKEKWKIPVFARIAHILDLLDHMFCKLFLRKTLAHRESLGNPVGIIVNEHMLKFHNNDLRESIKKTLE